MKNVSLNDLRDILDETGLRHVKKENVLLVSLPADEDFGCDVLILLAVEGSRIRAVAGSRDFQAPRANRIQALEFCNRWNDDKAAPRAYLDEEGYFRLDWFLYTDVDIVESYIKERFVDLFIASSWQFFKEAGQEFADFERAN